MIYFDHAASSYPKPKEVADAMYEAVTSYSANPGRGGHKLAEKAKDVIEETRKKVANVFGAPGKKHVWFYQNATMALNQAIAGFPFQEGDHVVTTMFEHNSIIRPLEKLVKDKKITVTYIEPNEEGLIEAEEWKKAVTDKTKMFAITHASNVTGALVNILSISNIAKEHEIVVLVDASQTAGTIDIKMDRDGIDLLAFAGHKSLLGPQGTGVLISKGDYHLTPLVVGGTGSQSELLSQPASWPNRYEAGTLNTPGIAGLSAGIDAVLDLGIENIWEHEQTLMKLLLDGLTTLSNVNVYGPSDLSKRVAVVPFEITGVSSQEVAMILDKHYQIAVRAGMHCAPKTHQMLQTTDSGLIRVSFGPYNRVEEVETLLKAIEEITEAFM
ncbi:aminotransferase class V-fold PLP-dependent enzyme [Alkalihalobacillus sp. MEB130]|uniref:aminotransferase class V-fold PLP-dependent enzyme n=1 Tax=Alkalihalobacillus sp. MEB130 TaxID=2976704 RepID=UPI0028DD51A5|nr:aminotransferase class V-fold PLP-dependent enzyme [Alkalihalobacillus sp. MEB130]MDT8862820.1 aminotransferase class V-fold PLP-dependent enzyme [Alkalihalobacillus sp. MEB130]